MATITVLVSIDILTGIYFWNRNNLYFNPSEFNSLITPLAAIVSSIISSVALIISLKQNIIVRSQHFRPYFEKEIERYIELVKKQPLRDNLLPEQYRRFNGLTFMKLVTEVLFDLTHDTDYLEDLERYQHGETLNKTYFKERSYYSIALFLTGYGIGLFNAFYFDDLRTLIEEINISKLSETDKKQLKKQIRRIFLEDYLSYLSSEKSSGLNHPLIPMVIRFPEEKSIEFKQLYETKFADHFDWFNQELRK